MVNLQRTVVEERHGFAATLRALGEYEGPFGRVLAPLGAPHVIDPDYRRKDRRSQAVALRLHLSHDRRVKESERTPPRAYDVEDAFEANELFQEHGFTDGLPIVPPTEPL